MNAATNIDISKMSSKELVALYNKLANSSITKFADRKTAEKRVQRLLDAQAEGEATMAKTAEPAEEPKAKRSSKKKAEPKAAQPKPKATKQLATRSKVEHDHDGKCPFCGADASAITPAGKEGTVAGDERNVCHECGVEYWREDGSRFAAAKKSVSRSGAIAASWANDAVREARSARIHITCNGEQFKSVAEAFRHFKLPMTKHIGFRMRLREAGKLNFTADNGDVFKFKVSK